MPQAVALATSYLPRQHRQPLQGSSASITCSHKISTESKRALWPLLELTTEAVARALERIVDPTNWPQPLSSPPMPTLGFLRGKSLEEENPPNKKTLPPPCMSSPSSSASSFSLFPLSPSHFLYPTSSHRLRGERRLCLRVTCWLGARSRISMSRDVDVSLYFETVNACQPRQGYLTLRHFL